MSSTQYGFVTINDHGDTSQNGQLTFSVSTHTGRSQRTKSFDIEADTGGQASIEVVQTAASLFITIDHFEDNNGNTVTELPATAGTFYIVGYSNVSSLYPTETSSKEYTDLNDYESGVCATNGMLIVESGGTSHSAVPPYTPFTYGGDAQYLFKIPFYLDSNTTTDPRVVEFTLEDGDDQVVEVGTVRQAASENENS